MDWPGKNKPEAEPGCGFLNEHCPKDDTHVKSITVAIVLFIALFIVALFAMTLYRRWKIEQEIEGLLWKIDPSEIHGYPHPDNMMSSPSKVSIARKLLLCVKYYCVDYCAKMNSAAMINHLFVH